MVLYTEMDDWSLVELSKAGEEAAFRTLVERHGQMVFNFCNQLLHNRSDSEDMTQETFIRLFRALDRLTPQAKFSTYLLTVARNLCYNYTRDHREESSMLSFDGEFKDEDGEHRQPQYASNEASPTEQAIAREEYARVLAAINALDALHREILLLREVQGMSYDEIAQTLGCRTGTVKSRLARARGKLIEVLGEDVEH